MPAPLWTRLIISFPESTGYHIELVGWEETVSSFGRPQALINQDLDKCELFIGMIWKRWGTAPDNKGNYSSGFEEELDISIKNHKSKGRPSISLFFKQVDQETLRDPGEQLKRVLQLRNSIIAGKELYFEEFKDSREFEKKFRRRIVRYVQELQSDDANQARLSGARSLSEGSEPPSSNEVSLGKEIIPREGAAFLHELVRKSEVESVRPTALEVARFRLMGIILRTSGNDEESLGVHDANMIFMKRTGLTLGLYEKYGLIDGGLVHFSSKNVPLWCWINSVDGLSSGLLPHLSLF